MYERYKTTSICSEVHYIITNVLTVHGYPNGVTEKDIPYSSQIIHVADVFDAIVTKRQYTTHVNISETLKLLVKDAHPTRQTVALDLLGSHSKLGKISKKVLKILFKVVTDDTLYEISGTMNYTDYLKEQIKRLDKIKKYEEKMQKAKSEKDVEYYKEYMKLLFDRRENYENYRQVADEYEKALEAKERLIARLYQEIDIIKELKKTI